MIQKSTEIVRGKVVGSYAAFHGTTIYTHLRIQVLERWKGPGQSSVEVLIPGGTAGGFRQSYIGAPKLAGGQEYLLFLWTGRNGRTHVIGFTQGLFALQKSASGETVAVRAAATDIMLDPNTGQVVNDEPLTMPLRDLGARISATLAGGATN